MRRLLPILPGFLLALASVRAGAEGFRLMIGPDRSVVRELREVTFTATVHDVVFENIPATADLESLQVGGDRQGVKLLSWQRLRAPEARASQVTWRAGQPVRPDPVIPAGGGVLCRLETSSMRPRQIELIYQLSGLTWRADYDITIRGDIANHLEPLSLDLNARVVLSNGTPRAFPGAQVVLVGRDEQAKVTAPAVGQLMLDDLSPLADLWRTRPDAPGQTHAYPLPDAVSLPALGEVSIQLAKASRQPSERLYSMETELGFLQDEGPWQPLHRYLVLRNDPGHGLGLALPPGEAMIFLGGVRGGLYQQAQLAHTARGEELRISLGTSRGVTAHRRTERRAPGVVGSPEQSVVLQLANALPTAVNVEVWERPPVPLAWDVVRSSRPFERHGQRLFYTLQVAARSEAEIDYTVRLTEPEP